MNKINIKGSVEKWAEIQNVINKMWEHPLRIGVFPKPVIVWNKKSSGMNWICKSDEKNPYTDCECIYCVGHGNTPQEAYDDWLQNYSVDIIYDGDD